MTGKLQWVAAHGDGASVLACRHRVAGVRPLGAEYRCEQCMWCFDAQPDQELAAVAGARAEESGERDPAT